MTNAVPETVAAATGTVASLSGMTDSNVESVIVTLATAVVAWFVRWCFQRTKK